MFGFRYSCDLGRLTIYTFVEAAPPDLLLSAPDSYVTAAQNQCTDHAALMLETCNFVLEKVPHFDPRDPHMAACLYQAIRITQWDLFRHPSPSMSLKKLTAKTCVPAIILLHRLAARFSYGGTVVS